MTLCNPMDCSMSGFPVLHYLPELAQTQIHWVDDAIQPSHPLLSPSPPALNLSQYQGIRVFSNELALCIRWPKYWSPPRLSRTPKGPTSKDHGLSYSSDCSVIQSCPSICNPMNCSTPGLPHHSPEFAQVHVHCISDAIQPSHPLTLFSLCSQSFPATGTFPKSCPFTWDDQNTGASASATVLTVNIQGWSPLRLTGLISLQSKGRISVFSSTTVWRYKFFDILPSLWTSFHNRMWPLERP